MKIGWITPLRKKCGISLLAEKYAAVLASQVELVAADADEFLENRTEFLKKLSGCNLVHIQYEPSFFLKGRTDSYPALCRAIPCKKVATLHEVYRRIPGVFPREDVRGPGPLKYLKQLVWDYRHPHWASFFRHAKKNFCVDALLVQSNFQKEILVDKGSDASRIHVIPLPVNELKGLVHGLLTAKGPITLGATGFINPLYDYERLFAVLEKLDFDWRFLWIGGLRRVEERGLLHFIESEIARRGWKERFTLTGPVFGDERNLHLDKVQVFCALFKDRSTSETLADAIAAHKLILASRLPITEELVSLEPLCLLAEKEPESIARQISALLQDTRQQDGLRKACQAYCRRFSYDVCSKEVVGLYQELLV